MTSSILQLNKDNVEKYLFCQEPYPLLTGLYYYPTIIKDALLGEQQHQAMLSMLFLDVAKLDLDIPGSDWTKLLFVYEKSPDFFKALQFLAKYKFRTSVEIINYKYIALGGVVLSRKEWVNLVQEIVALEYNLDIEKLRPKKQSPAVQKFLQKRSEAEKIVSDIKSKNGTQKTMQTLVSAIAAKHPSCGFDCLNWSYTRFFDQFHRLGLIDNYSHSIQAKLAGASDVELVHWSER